MKYMLMIYDKRDRLDSANPGLFEQSKAEHEALAAYLISRGSAFSGEALQPSGMATTIRKRGDEFVTT